MFIISKRGNGNFSQGHLPMTTKYLRDLLRKGLPTVICLCTYAYTLGLRWCVVAAYISGSAQWRSQILLFTRREAMLRRVIGNTLIRLYGAFWTVFTRPAISPPKMNRFGWNLESCQSNFGGWPRQTLGGIRAVATVWEGAEKCLFFGLVNNARFHRFPVEQFSRILHTTTSIGVAM